MAKKKSEGKGTTPKKPSAKNLVKKIMRDPSVKAFINRQKELTEATLKEIVERVTKKIQSKI